LITREVKTFFADYAQQQQNTKGRNLERVIDSSWIVSRTETMNSEHYLIRLGRRRSRKIIKKSS